MVFHDVTGRTRGWPLRDPAGGIADVGRRSGMPVGARPEAEPPGGLGDCPAVPPGLFISGRVYPGGQLALMAGPRGDPRGGASPGADGGLGERPFHDGKVTQPTDTPRTRGDLSARPLGYVRHPAHTRTSGRKECPIPAWARYMQASAWCHGRRPERRPGATCRPSPSPLPNVATTATRPSSQDPGAAAPNADRDAGSAGHARGTLFRGYPAWRAASGRCGGHRAPHVPKLGW
jgi:hypothetical protein